MPEESLVLCKLTLTRPAELKFSEHSFDMYIEEIKKITSNFGFDMVHATMEISGDEEKV